jgi:hypothetical protein
MGYCESCGKNTQVRWVVCDDDMECEMCAKCVKVNRTVMTIEYIDMD